MNMTKEQFQKYLDIHMHAVISLCVDTARQSGLPVKVTLPMISESMQRVATAAKEATQHAIRGNQI